MQFYGVSCLTEAGLARAIKAEKALTKNTINQLVADGMIRQSGSYEYVITHEGIEHLVSNGLVKPAPAKAKPVRNPTLIKTAVEKMASSETAAVLAELSNQRQAETAKTDPVVCEPEPEPDPKPAAPTFDELVRRGLERLNKHLKFQSIAIEDKRLKITTLTSLADTLDGFDVSLAEMLRKIATDLNKLGEATNG